jgi:parallel beta-helix repeat protein
MKETAVALILIGFIALNIVCVLPAKAQYEGSITINADGSVSPSTAPIQQTGDTYTLTNNLNITASNIGGNIIVQRNNTVLDGNGHAVGKISLNNVSNVTVKNFIITIAVYKFLPRGYNGITLMDSSYVTVANNTITYLRGIYQLPGVGDMYAGIYVEGGSSNTIVGNNLVNNEYGMYFSGTKNNLIVENNIINNETSLISSGIVLKQAFNNMIYHNNFMSQMFSATQAGVSNSSNVWDIGYPGGGNYWKDYHKKYPNATEIDSSGIGNTSYVIDGQNIDRYPLMEAFNSTFFKLQTTPPKISIQSPMTQTYNESSVPLVFSVDVVSAVKAVNWTGYSLDGKQNVTITGNTTLTGLSSGLHVLLSIPTSFLSENKRLANIFLLKKVMHFEFGRRFLLEDKDEDFETFV